MIKLLYSFILTIFIGVGLNAQLNVDFQSNNLEPNNGQTIDIDVSVSDFVDIVSLQYLILWDSTVLTYATITNVTTELPQFIFTEDPNGISSIGTPDNMSNGLDGVLSVSWSQASTEPFTLPDDTRLFTIQLRAVGDPCDATDLTIGELPFRPIEVIDANLMDIGAVSNTLDFQIPGAGCGGGGDDEVGFIAGTVAGPSGDTVCMPIQVVNFMDIQTFQGSVDWDPSQMMFTGVDNINAGITGLTPGSFNTDSTLTTGTLSWAWFDFSGLNPLNFADSTALFELCFIPTGEFGDCYDVSFVDMPTPVETSNSMGQSLPFYTESGDVCVGEVIVEPENDLLIMPVVNGSFEMGSNACIDFMVMDFDSVGSIQYNVTWDDAILSFTEVNNFDPAMGLASGNFNQTGNDKLRLTWNEPSSSSAGLSLDDGTVIYSMCFDAVGDCNSTTTLEFINDGGINIEIANGMAEEIPYTLKPLDITVFCGIVCDNPTVTDPSCPETLTGSIVLSCTGDLSYSWENVANGMVISTSNSLVGVGAGFYDVTVTDNVSAEQRVFNFTLNDPPAINLSGESFDATCSNGGMIDLDCEGGTGVITCVWSGPTSIPNNVKNPTGLMPGTYVVTCTDENNCSVDMNFFIDMIGGGESLEISTTPANCSEGGTISVVIIDSTPGNYAYEWMPDLPGTDNNTDVPAGTYELTVTNTSTGCTATATAIVGMNMSNPPSVDGIVTNAGCDGGMINVMVTNGSGNYSYDWTGGLSGQNPTDVDPGDYDLTVTDDDSGCTASTSFTVTDDIDPLNVTAETISDIRCFGDTNGSALVTVSGGCNPTCTVTLNGVPIQGDCSNLNALGAGDYVVTLVDINGMMTASFTIAGPDAALEISAPTVTDVCPINGDNSGAIDITVSGGTPEVGNTYTYAWMDGNGNTWNTEDLSDIPVGTYSVTVTDDNICTAEIFGIVVAEDMSPECDATVELNLGEVVITSDYNGVQVSCSGDCDGTANLSVLTGTAPFEVEINGGTAYTSDTNIIPLTGLCEGLNNISIVDGAGQTASTSVTLESTDVVSILLDGDLDCEENNAGDVTICTEVSGGTGVGFVFEWSSGGSAACEEDLSAGTYILTVTDSNGCSSEKSFDIESCDEPPGRCFEALNILTPNGDGSNDIFIIECAGDNSNQLSIYDRYGQRVYSASDYNNDFDGIQSDGTMLEEGPYFWVLEIDFANGETRIEKGTITVLR